MRISKGDDEMTIPKSITANNVRYIVDSDLCGVPRVWLHRKRSEPAEFYFAGTSLTEGTMAENAEFIRCLVRQHTMAAA